MIFCWQAPLDPAWAINASWTLKDNQSDLRAVLDDPEDISPKKCWSIFVKANVELPMITEKWTKAQIATFEPDLEASDAEEPKPEDDALLLR